VAHIAQSRCNIHIRSNGLEVLCHFFDLDLCHFAVALCVLPPLPIDSRSPCHRYPCCGRRSCLLRWTGAKQACSAPPQLRMPHACLWNGRSGCGLLELCCPQGCNVSGLKQLQVLMVMQGSTMVAFLVMLAAYMRMLTMGGEVGRGSDCNELIGIH